MKAIDNYHL